MNYVNNKSWLVFELDAIDYIMISINSKDAIKYEYAFSISMNSSKTINGLIFKEHFTDSFNISTQLATHLPLKLKNPKNILHYAHVVNVNISKEKLTFLKNSSVVKDLTNIKLTIENSRLYTGIVNNSSINCKTDVVFTPNIVKYAVLFDDSVINSEHTLHSNFQTPTYLKFNPKDKISSKSIVKLTKYERYDNTIGDLKNYTLNSLNDKPLYHLSYYKQL